MLPFCVRFDLGDCVLFKELLVSKYGSDESDSGGSPRGLLLPSQSSSASIGVDPIL